MRIKIIVLLLLLWVSCSGNPQPPPPGEVCGNVFCGQGENSTNCPADCPAPPPPDLCGNGVCDPGEKETCKRDCPEEPPPPEKCDPDNYVFKGCPTITRDFSSNRVAGIYVGVMGTRGFNFSRLFRHFKILNYAYLHFDSPWDHDGLYYARFDPVRKIYLVKVIDPELRKQVRNLFRAAGYYNVGVGVTFLSEYCNTKYKGPFQSPYHPWRDNDVRINWGGKVLTKANGGACGNKGEQTPFYKQWNRRLPLDPNVVAFTWGDENDVDTFRPVNDLGIGFFAYVDLIIEEFKLAQEEFPNLHALFRPANEPSRYSVPLNPQDEDFKGLDDSRGNPLDDRTFNFIYGKLTKAGLRNSEKTQYVVEETFRNFGGPVNVYFTDKTYRRYIVPKRYKYEFHGVEKVHDSDWKNAKGEDIEFFTKILKMDPKRLVLSNDGDKGERDFPREYYPRLKSIYQWQKQNPGSTFDYKVASEKVGNCVWKTKKMQENLDCIIPEMEREIFQ